MKYTYGYRPYRGGRVRRRRIIRGALLAVVLIAAAIWVFGLLLPHREDGAQSLAEGQPAENGTAAADSPGTGGGEGMVSGTAVTYAASTGGDTARVPSAMKNPGKAQPIFPASPEGPENRRMILCGADGLLEEAEALTALQQDGTLTGVAVVMKDEEGRLRYPSEIERVQESEIIQPAEGIAEAVARLRAAGIPLTAVVYAHEDSLFPALYEASALKNIDQESWHDLYGRIRIDPANGDALQYLTEIAAELSGMGFSEILLRGVGYPSEGAIERIVYANDRFGAVTGAVMAVKTAAPTMRVSVWLDSPESIRNTATGQSVPMLAQIVDRCFVELPDSDPDEAPAVEQAVRDAAKGVARGVEHLVFVTGDADGTEALGEVLFDLPLSGLQND